MNYEVAVGASASANFASSVDHACGHVINEAATMREISTLFFVCRTLLAGPAFSPSTAQLKEMTATVINLNGHLRARVLSTRPLRMKDTYEVTCIQFRGGTAEATHVMHATRGTAERLR